MMAEDMRNAANTHEMREFERGYAVPDCVVLDSAYCSMGRMVALGTCDAAGWAYHDTTTLLGLVPECGVTAGIVDAFEAKSAAAGADLDAAIAYQNAHRRSWHALADDGTTWGEPATYDLMINTDLIRRDFATYLLPQLMMGQR